MPDLDLSRFCKPNSRRGLDAPFSRGEYTYATNGHIMVRVPRREDVPNRDDIAGKFEKLFPAQPLVFVPIKRAVPLPAISKKICYDCAASKHEHNCPCRTCTCACETCNGTGLVDADDKYVPVKYRNVIISKHYAKMLLSFPNLEIEAWPKGGKNPLVFRFSGGDGLLMPLRPSSSDSTFIDLEQD